MNRFIVSLLVGAAVATSAAAQEYPVKPIRLVVPNPPGGSNDLVARLAGDPAATKEIGKRAAAFVLSHHSWAARSREIDGVLRELLKASA